MSNMVFCRGCGKEIHESAVSCPHCGAAQGAPSKEVKSKVVAGVLALFLGGLGIHRFYLGSGGAFFTFCFAGHSSQRSSHLSRESFSFALVRSLGTKSMGLRQSWLLEALVHDGQMASAN